MKTPDKTFITWPRHFIILLTISTLLPIIGRYHLALYGLIILAYRGLPVSPKKAWIPFFSYVFARVGAEFSLQAYQNLISPFLLTLRPLKGIKPLLKLGKREIVWIYAGLLLWGASLLILSYFYTYSSLTIKNSMVLWNMAALALIPLRLPLYKELVAFGLSLNSLLECRTHLMAFGAALSLFFIGKYFPRLIKIILIGSIIGCGLWVLWGFQDMLHHKFMLLLGRKFPSFYERLIVWAQVGSLSAGHPWIGLGPQTLFTLLKKPLHYFYEGSPITKAVRHPHNIFLELKASLGILGYTLGIGGAIGELVFDSRNPLRIAFTTYILVMMSSYLSFFRDSWFWAWMMIMLLWVHLLKPYQGKSK